MMDDKAFDEEMFYAEQTRILTKIGNALVEATPEWWNRAKLELTMEEEGCSHVIKNREHPRDIVTPTDELYAGTFELEDLFKSRGKMWRKAIIEATRVGDDWEYTVDYAY